MTNNGEATESVLKRSYISKRDVLIQVWRIYNLNVPRTPQKAQKEDGSYDKYLELKEIPDTTGAKESEENGRLRFQKFRDLAEKYLKEVLKQTNSSLKCYEKEDTPLIPVVVGATFATIFDMNKYKFVTPQKMLDEEEELLLHPVIKAMDEFDENYYFMMRISENLKYFYNIKPYINENNLNRKIVFDYPIIQKDGRIIINQSKKDVGENVKIDKKAVKLEIEEFKRNYIEKIKKQARIKHKANNLRLQIEKALSPYSESRVHDLRENLFNRVMETYGLSKKRKKELEVVFPLDFTEPEYNVCHSILNEVQKNDFYKELRGKFHSIGEEQDSKNSFGADFYDEEKLNVREQELIDEIKSKIGELSEQVYLSSCKKTQRIRLEI